MPTLADDYIPFAAELARGAGAILMQHYLGVSVEYKGRFDTVTVADRASERWVVERIRSRFPSHSIVAEEGGGHTGAGEFVWYVDPLDGTTNFAHGLPRFCVSIGVWGRGEGLAGVVYDPVRDDLFTAERGSGAYLNARRIRVSEVADIEKGLFATGFPSSIRQTNPNLHYFHQVAMRTHGVRRTGSAALDLCSVAQGHFEGFWEIGLQSWDVGAGLVILAEAGGEYSDFQGARYQPGQGPMVATNGQVTQGLLDMFADVARGDARIPLPSLGSGSWRARTRFLP